MDESLWAQLAGGRGAQGWCGAQGSYSAGLGEDELGGKRGGKGGWIMGGRRGFQPVRRPDLMITRFSIVTL
jgi:hypothetical protein